MVTCTVTLAIQLTEPAAAKAQLPCLDILTHSFALFPRPKTYNSTDANHLRTLWKSTRVGYAATFATPPLRHSATYPPLCFHILMNTFSRSPFLLTSIQNPGGVAPSPSEDCTLQSTISSQSNSFTLKSNFSYKKPAPVCRVCDSVYPDPS